METIIHTDPNIFGQLQPQWNALLRTSKADTPFLTYEWQKTWSDCLCSCEGELHLLTVRDGGALLGIAPLFVVLEMDKDGNAKRLLRLIGSVDASDYLDLIAVRGCEREVFAAMHLAIIDLQSSSITDVTAVDMIHDLITELDRKGITLRLANASGRVRDVLRAAGIEEKIGKLDRTTTIADLCKEKEEPDQTGNR